MGLNTVQIGLRPRAPHTVFASVGCWSRSRSNRAQSGEKLSLEDLSLRRLHGGLVAMGPCGVTSFLGTCGGMHLCWLDGSASSEGAGGGGVS